MPFFERCPECKGRGWHVGDCHPREVCGACDGTGKMRCCPAAVAVVTPSRYVWKCADHDRFAQPTDPVPKETDHGADR